jgi:hypothetical protein
MQIHETKEFARQWIAENRPCIYRHGWAYRGALARQLTQQQAMKLLPQYSFGMGFNMISCREYKGRTVLEFNELGENDLL